LQHLPCGWERDYGVPEAVVAKQAHIWSPEAALCIDGREAMLKISLKTAFLSGEEWKFFLCFFLFKKSVFGHVNPLSTRKMFSCS
jgi:hypothetical protein